MFNPSRPDGTILFNTYKIPAANAAGILQALKSIVPSGLKRVETLFAVSYHLESVRTSFDVSII